LSICLHCSSENDDTSGVCRKCGTPLPIDLEHTLSLPPTGKAAPPPPDGFEPGSLFARRYQLIEELGMGGMGRVYRVLDKKLDEEIAFKVIRPEIAKRREVIARFSSELKLARQVVHRNVARMFDLNEDGGIHYITMEYVRGENLKRLIRKVGRLSPGQAVPIACQISDGLAEAHRLGIIHHDLKPQNVMIDEEGQAKIMDFGLARLLAREGRDGLGSRSGSPAYIAPEQISGRGLDGRADLYSLGVLIYEMLTGQIPFKAERVEEIIEKHLSEQPRDPRELNPGISPELARLVMKCLEKDPANRYQSADEVKEALDRLRDRVKPGFFAGIKGALRLAGIAGALGAVTLAAIFIFGPPESWKRSLAVLSVDNIGLEAVNPAFLDGLQREVRDRLSGIPSLRVLPSNSVSSFDLSGKTTPQIGKTLGVRYLLKITLASEGDTVDAKIYVYDARKNVNPVPMTYRKGLSDYRALQDEIAVYTANALGVELGEEQLTKFSRRGTNNIEAYSLFLGGMRLLRDEGEDNVNDAVAQLQRAIEIDPDYPLGHWGLGYAYENLYYSKRDEDKDPAVLEKMYEHLRRASELDPSIAETNLGLGWYHFNKLDNGRAFDSFRKALKLEPENYLVNRDVGAFLMSVGLYRQSMRRLKKAIKLSPRDPLPWCQIAQCLYFLGRCDKALVYVKKALAVDENDRTANFMDAVLLVLTRRFEEADRRIEALERLDFPSSTIDFLREVVAALRTGRGRPHDFDSGQPRLSPQGTYMYLLFGMKEEALANIRAGIEGGLVEGMYLYSYPSLVKNPWYDGLRDDPRFEAILAGQKEAYVRELKPLEKL
jgi:serine/threonine protein kinase/Flp pilus assembly protein TadD